MNTLTPSFNRNTLDDCQVEVVCGSKVTSDMRVAWLELRACNPSLWSPYFDFRMFELLCELAPRPHLVIVRREGKIVALLPFQGKASGLARPLGAPLSDQHNLIQAGDTNFDLGHVIKASGVAGFVYSGVHQSVDGTVNAEQAVCHVADLSRGVEDYKAWRLSNWKEQVKKNERRKRQGERQWGPMRIETACPKSSRHFETLMKMKQAKYIETKRHNVLAVPWINTYLRRLYTSSDPNFVGEITLLYFGEHLAAMEFGLRADNVMHSWFPTFDRAYSQVSPGILLMDAMIESCGERGITKIDLGIGHDQYKRHASNAPILVWSGIVPVSPARRAATLAFRSADAWMEKTAPARFGQILGKLERRSEMILAAEPTLGGRIRGYLSALRAIG